MLKAGFRTGDDAPMAVIELVDRDVNARKIDKPKTTMSNNAPKRKRCSEIRQSKAFERLKEPLINMALEQFCLTAFKKGLRKY